VKIDEKEFYIRVHKDVSEVVMVKAHFLKRKCKIFSDLWLIPSRSTIRKFLLIILCEILLVKKLGLGEKTWGIDLKILMKKNGEDV